jgi:plasmid maintenance system antidote protein VapI
MYHVKILCILLTEEETMNQDQVPEQKGYDPNHLLDTLIKQMKLKNDAALCRALEVAPPVISKIRHKRLPVGASLLIRMHELTGMNIRELRDLMGDRRTKYRLSNVQGKPKTEQQVVADQSHQMSDQAEQIERSNQGGSLH